MKAIVKATGKIVDVRIDYNQEADYIAQNGQLYWQEELDFNNLNIKDMREETMIEAINDIDSIRCMVEDIHEDITNTPDYWTRLEHQYAGMVLQGLVTRGEVLGSSVQEIARDITEISCEVAHALVEKMKEKEERK